MAWSYSIDRKKRLVVTTAWDEVALRDIREHQAAIIQGPASDPTFNQLLDFRRVTKVALDTEAIRTAASRTIFVRGSRRAIVVLTEELFGLSRMFDMFREMQGGEEVLRVFRDMDEARQSLSGDAT